MLVCFHLSLNQRNKALVVAPKTRVFSYCACVFSAKPEWKLEPQKVDAGVTEGAVFDCAAEGIPAPQIQWYINGKTLDSKSLV